MKERVYHGWIYIEKSPGMKDYYGVHRCDDSSDPIVKGMGYGVEGAAAAVDFFETELKLGPVKLEQTPIGVRVFTIATTTITTSIQRGERNG